MLTSPSAVLCVHLPCTALLVRGLDSNQLDHEQAACLPCAMYDAHLHLQLGDDTVAKLWKIHRAGGEQASVFVAGTHTAHGAPALGVARLRRENTDRSVIR